LECRRCGAEISDDAAYCMACGQATREGAHEQDTPVTAPESKAGIRQKPAIAYAGFWLRVFAWIIDIFLLSIFVGIFILNPLMPRAGISPENPWAMFNSNSRQVLAINLLVLMVQWCYFALLESSAWQASFGKRLLGIYVTDAQGKRISFARASGRYFAMIVSTLTLGFGYVMGAFTPKKQMLHDMIADCLVLKKTSMQP
jgi:uncharacterized RDD family membrane protein YckC